MKENKMSALTSLLLFFSCYCIALPHCFLSAQISNEASVLLSINSGVVDPLGRLGDWTLSSAHCNWTGVHCNSLGAVDSLNLNHMNLSGLIKDDIKHLPSLSYLNISSNAFTSSLPNALSSLSSLKVIDISQNLFVGGFPGVLGKLAGLTALNGSSNSFTGPLPDDLGNVSSLETLDLRGNFFEGSIPTSFKNLQKLKFLGLSGNNLTGGLPREIGMLSSLESMIIGYNEFDGEIPAEFGNLTYLRYIDLAVGNLGGAIPDELGRLKLLDTLFLYNNNFEGKIPPSIGNITSLKLLDLSANLLSGEIPVQIGELKNLQLLNLMCNNLSGSVPPALGELTQLQVLELWNNSFSGALPDNLGHNSPLQWLDASSNAFSGSIPASLCNGGNLTKLILFNNALTGPIPTNLTSCFSLVRVRIQNNFLSGAIPVGLGKLGKLQRLELANNILSGKIPDDISLSTTLSFIDLSRNRLQFSLPFSVLSIPNLQTFIVSNNNLQGQIPDQFQDCPSLAVLDLSSNHFSGIIPTSVASCQKLVTLNLRNNQLTGEIPRPIANMPTLAVLDLSNNSLTGGIPENFGSSPALEMLNVSYNKLEGPVPTNGMLKTINPDDLVGNAGLCGGVLPPCNQNLLYVSHQQHVKHMIVGWFIGISSLLAIGFAMFGALSLYKKWSSGESWFKNKFETGNGEWPWRLVAFQRIGFASADILSCIKDSNIIGAGATGVVYKAEMQRTKAIVAVKKLYSSATDIEAGTNREDLVGEVNLLGKLRHRNIVRLLGFLHNDTNAMILYEYMPNGSLGEALHGKGRLLVDWVSRYNIALGVAQGLAYLHHDFQPPVIHRDIKSNNILLDGNLEARIADFGLARMMLRRNQTVTMVAGSYGYIAPEYGYTLKVDEKSDIYSYGVVLLELLTGKKPLEQEFGDSVHIVEWVRRRARDNAALEIHLDPNLGNCKHVQEEMLLVLRIALLCSAKLPKDRPSMRDVITMLGEAKPRRKSSSNSHGYESSKDKPIFSASPVNGLI